MSIYDALILCGLFVQLVAGFILSVEVIGLDRVASWTNNLSLLRKNIAEPDEGAKFFSWGRQSGAIFCAIVTMIGTYGITYYARKYYGDTQNLRWYQTVFIALAGGIITGVLALVVYSVIVYGLSAAVFGLRSLEARTRARSSGVLGFLLLFLGFLLQFSGTVGQSLSK